MAVSAGDQKISSFVLCQPDNLIRARPVGLYFDPTFSLDSVLGEVANDVIDVMARSVHLILLAYREDSYAFCLVKER